MEATNTCGDNGNQEYCIQTGYSNKKSCDNICNAGDHSGEFLTDIHDPLAQTWWQSETMFEGVQSPNQVNLTLHLGMDRTGLISSPNILLVSWNINVKLTRSVLFLFSIFFCSFQFRSRSSIFSGT